MNKFTRRGLKKINAILFFCFLGEHCEADVHQESAANSGNPIEAI